MEYYVVIKYQVWFRGTIERYTSYSSLQQKILDFMYRTKMRLKDGAKAKDWGPWDPRKYIAVSFLGFTFSSYILDYGWKKLVTSKIQ